MKGGAPMTQDIIIWALLSGMVGLIWVMAIAIHDDNQHLHGSLGGNASPNHRD